MKYFIFIFILMILNACSMKRVHIYEEELHTFKDDVNKSIIDGFYDNDTTNISETVYLLK